MEFTEIRKYDSYQRFLQEADPEELLMVAVERYQAEVLGVEDLITGGDIVSIMQSMAMKEDLTLKNKGGWVQIIALGRPKIKERLVLKCEAARAGTGKMKGWQKRIIRQDQARTGELYGDAG